MRCSILIVLCLFLLPGCDRRDPAVRQTSSPKIKSKPTENASASTPPDHAESSAPDSGLPKMAAPKTEKKPSQTTLLEGHGNADSEKLVTVDSKEVRLGKMRLVAPDGWKRVQSRIRVIIAEFILPRAEGDSADARITISSSGGNVLESVERWRRKKAANPDDKASQQLSIRGMNVDFEQSKIAGIDVTFIEFSPDSKRQQGSSAFPMMTPPGFCMKTVIVPVGDQVYSIKCYGPEKTMKKHSEEIDAFLHSMSRTESP